MRKILLSTIAVILISGAFSVAAYAVCTEGPVDTFTCDTNPPNPDPTGVQQGGNNNNLTVNVLPGAGIDTLNGNGGDAVGTGDGNNQITVNGAEISAQSNCLDAGQGNNVITVTDSNLLSSVGNCIETITPGTNLVNITNSIVRSTESEPVNASSGKDTINIIGSRLESAGNEGLSTEGDDDLVYVETSTISAAPNDNFDSIELGSGNDTLTIDNEVLLLNGPIDCGLGFDTIVFTMDVPEERLSFFSSQIALATLPDGNITINGFTYEWIGCELLVNELVGVRITRPIPTLSQWGLIAMAGLIGIAGLIFHRRKAAE